MHLLTHDSLLEGPKDAPRPKTFRFYINDGARKYLEVPYLEGVPKVRAILPDVLPLKDHLESFEIYFGKKDAAYAPESESDLYQLLDEWNAYSAQLPVVAFFDGGCRDFRLSPSGQKLYRRTNFVNELNEFVVYADLYLQKFRKVNPKLFERFIGDQANLDLLTHLSRTTAIFLNDHMKEVPCSYFRESLMAIKPRFESAMARITALIKERSRPAQPK